MPRGYTIFGKSVEDYYRQDDYALWAYGFRFTEYDKGFLSSCMISAR